MKSYKLIFTGAIVILSIILFISLFMVKNIKADEDYRVEINTSPTEVLFNVGNMKPGDKETSILKVNNDGNLDFNYTVSSRKEFGDDYLYNQLLLKVSNSEGLLYEGSFKDFFNFPLGTIAAFGSNSLVFTVELPFETGNEAQGKSTKVAFDFIAIGHEEQIPIDGQCFEPPFGNRNFTLQQKSTVPIKFHLRDSHGNLEDEILQNVRLEVTGPKDSGGNVKYIFTPKNGNLDFQKVSPPHYHAQLSPFDYPLVTDQWYKATVYVDNKEYCNKTFQVLKQGNRSNAP
ncbi:hypothetical protein ABES02_22110 [Neobacillus pocheonensis]|uniref:hypothetical protein n=1 Tax=Neobacillus pocheonensis TaxID=363869 RepID=UPI003D2C5AC7